MQAKLKKNSFHTRGLFLWSCTWAAILGPISLFKIVLPDMGISTVKVRQLWNRLMFIMEILILLTHWGQVTHIWVSKLAIIGSYNGLSPERRQAIIWTNAGTLGTNFSEISIEIYTFSFNKMHLKMLYGKWRPFCLGLNVLRGSSFILKWSPVTHKPSLEPMFEGSAAPTWD